MPQVRRDVARASDASDKRRPARLRLPSRGHTLRQLVDAWQRARQHRDQVRALVDRLESQPAEHGMALVAARLLRAAEEEVRRCEERVLGALDAAA